MTLDTLVAAKALEKAGMENGQAEAVATVIRDATAEQAMKDDMEALRIAMKADMEAFRVATKADLNAVEGRLRGELYKALWAFGLGIIGTHAVVIGAAFSIALWLWPPGAS